MLPTYNLYIIYLQHIKSSRLSVFQKLHSGFTESDIRTEISDDSLNSNPISDKTLLVDHSKRSGVSFFKFVNPRGRK